MEDHFRNLAARFRRIAGDATDKRSQLNAACEWGARLLYEAENQGRIKFLKQVDWPPLIRTLEDENRRRLRWAEVWCQMMLLFEFCDNPLKGLLPSNPSVYEQNEIGILNLAQGPNYSTIRAENYAIVADGLAEKMAQGYFEIDIGLLDLNLVDADEQSPVDSSAVLPTTGIFALRPHFVSQATQTSKQPLLERERVQEADIEKGVSMRDVAMLQEKGDELAATRLVKKMIDSKRFKATRIGQCPDDQRAGLYRLSEILSDSQKYFNLQKRETEQLRDSLLARQRKPMR